MVDVHPIWRYRRQFAPIERGVGTRDHRPRLRVRGGFAGEVPGVELSERGFDVLEVEPDWAASRSSASISMTLRNSMRIPQVDDLARRYTCDIARGGTTCRDDDRGNLLAAELRNGSTVRDFDIPAASDPGVHRAPTIVVDHVLS